MRAGTEGWKLFDYIMERLEERHELHMDVYGDDNKKRMSGTHETAEWNEFSYAVGNRSASIRIPTEVASAGGKGYLEDRRPGSNIDPYVTCSLMLETCILPIEEGKEISKPLLDHFFAWRKLRDENKEMSLI
jgi:glutamine synthetase